MASKKLHSRMKQVKVVSGDHHPSQCNHKINGKFIHYKPVRAAEGKETVETYDNDGTRQLIVPNRESTESPGIWPKSEFLRLKQQAHVITQKDRMAMIEEAERKKFQLISESEKRKEALQRAALEQKAKQGSKLAVVETEAAIKNQYVLQRAFELRQEQEDEIKNANGLILATKCLAIRQAQILEKELIHKELQEEDQRLDMMMEQVRQRAIKDEEERKHKKEKRNKRHVKEVSQQIYENEVQRLVEAERKEEESRNINKALIAMQREDAEKLKQKRLEQKQTRDELNQANAENEHYKLVQNEEQRIADLRVQEFMRNKAEREAIREAELAEAKAAKEREIARLRAQQETAQDQQAAVDELNALRIQEEVERQWRENEIAAAKKRKEQLEEMRLGRERQIEDLRKAQAMEIERDEKEFHQVAKVQNDLYQKDLEKRRQKKEAAIRHRKELLKQINDKEKERIVQHKAKFEEGGTLRMEQEVRSIHIQNILKKKVQRLRENNIPDNFVRDIERQLKLI